MITHHKCDSPKCKPNKNSEKESNSKKENQNKESPKESPSSKPDSSPKAPSDDKKEDRLVTRDSVTEEGLIWNGVWDVLGSFFTISPEIKFETNSMAY